MKSIDDNKLIKHLEQTLEQENKELAEMAIDAMDIDDDTPFPENRLLESYRGYKLKEQRVLGIIDTIEMVKAFLEGFYDGPPHDEEEGE